MQRSTKAPELASSSSIDRKMPPGQIVLVLQGGGALGSYQAGVYQAMHEAGIEPDWIVGTSIGAAGAPPRAAAGVLEARATTPGLGFPRGFS
jgi:NTE family protein